MSEDYDSFGGFDGFGGFGRRRNYFPPLPTDIYLLGENTSNAYVPLLMDTDQNLLLRNISRIYFSSTVKTIPSGTPGLLIAAPTDDYERNVIGIDIINCTANPVSCKLYWTTSSSPPDSSIFGICGGNIAAHALWSWRGQLLLDTKSIYGLAGTSSALRAYFSLAAPMNNFR